MTARGHHFVPRFYLEGFIQPGTDRRLFAFDLDRGASFPSTPDDAGKRRDFYRVRAQGVPPNAVEEALSSFEGKVAPVVHDIRQTRRLPTGREFDLLMEFVAASLVRVPRFRSSSAEDLEPVYEAIMRMIVASPDRFRSIIEEARGSGYVPADLPPPDYENVKAFVERGNYVVELTAEWHIDFMIKAVEKMMPVLKSRAWGLVEAHEGAGHFVASDNPVWLVWTTPAAHGVGPGFALRETEVSFPLGRSLMLVGRFEGVQRSVEADAPLVADLNTRTICAAERFVYSSEESFPWSRDGRIAASTELVDVFARR